MKECVKLITRITKQNLNLKFKQRFAGVTENNMLNVWEKYPFINPYNIA